MDTNKRQKIGWGLHIAVGSLLVLNGLVLPFIVSGADTFEDDTGHARGEVEAAYPGLVDALDGRGTTIGILVLVYGALILSTGVTGLRHGGSTAWTNAWVAVAGLAAITVYFIAVPQRFDIAAQYGLFAAAGIAGQFLLRPAMREGASVQGTTGT